MHSSHLKALIRKNTTLWKRNWVCSCVELLVPILMCLLFKVFRDSSPPKTIPETSYYSMALSIESSDAPTLLKKCSLNVNEESGGLVGLAPQSEPVIQDLAGYLTCNLIPKLF